MYLLYLDDSGSAANANEEYLVLAGVSVFERQAYWLTKKLDELAASVFPPNPGAVEFHASAIFAGREPPWNRIRKKEERRQIIKDVLGLIGQSHASTRVFACAVHKKSFPNSDPMELAFEDLCSRFDLYLTRLLAVDQDKQRGLIIADESSYETSLQKLAREFRLSGTRWRKIKYLCDVPMFVNSQASRLVQLADHVAYAVFRRYESGDTNYFDIIASRFDEEGGRIHGLVHKQTAFPDCKCPACLSRHISDRLAP